MLREKLQKKDCLSPLKSSFMVLIHVEHYITKQKTPLLVGLFVLVAARHGLRLRLEPSCRVLRLPKDNPQTLTP